MWVAAALVFVFFVCLKDRANNGDRNAKYRGRRQIVIEDISNKHKPKITKIYPTVDENTRKVSAEALLSKPMAVGLLAMGLSKRNNRIF
ncbi:hypothetical protein HpBGD14_14850 [Helicobacter pylori]